MSLGDILPNSNLQRPRRLDPMAAPQQPKKRFHRFGGAVLSPQLRGPRTWLHWSAFLAWWLFRDKIDAFCSGMVSAAAEHGMVRFPLQQTVGQRKKKFNPTMTDKECPKQWCRKATDYWKYVRTECFLNEKKLSTAWHSCALRLPALFLDTHEGCINLLLSCLAAGCSLGLAKSKMHARTRQNKTKQVTECMQAHILCYHTFTWLKTRQERDKAFIFKPRNGTALECVTASNHVVAKCVTHWMRLVLVQNDVVKTCHTSEKLSMA